MQLPNGRSFSFWGDQTDYRATYHVSQNHPKADDGNPGTVELPWQTLSRAAQSLGPAEKVVVHTGVYRETVQPARGGNGPDSMVAYEAAPGELVRITGAESWKPQWRPQNEYHLRRRHKEGVCIWEARLPVEQFQGYNPFGLNNMSNEYMSYGRSWSREETNRFQLRRGMVFCNGKRLPQVFRLWDLTAGEGLFWVEEPGYRLFASFPEGCVPSDDDLWEVSCREQVFSPAQSHLGYIRVSGFQMDMAADGVPIPQRSLLSTHHGHHWILEGNRISWANASGMDIGRASWHRERYQPAGGHIVRGNSISDCGICGICGVSDVDGSLIEENLIERIGWQNLEHIYECAAIKFHECAELLIRRNVIRDITHSCGIWLDINAEACRLTENLFVNIETLLAGIYLEFPRETNWVDRNVFWDMRDAPLNKPPKDGIPGGIGLSGDCAENVQAFHNFFGRIQGHYAVAFHVAQKERVIHGRTGVCFGHGIHNNIFSDGKRHVKLARDLGLSCDGNLHAAGHGTIGEVEYPAPARKADWKGWCELLGNDANGARLPMHVDFDTGNLVLSLEVEGRPSVAVPQESLPELGLDLPGPFPLRLWEDGEKGMRLKLRLQDAWPWLRKMPLGLG